MASNVEGKFQYLIETKELIKGALNEKGLAISDADTFRSYADSIRNAEFKSDDVRYVTFMNGTRQLYVKPVATGDDCVDVKAKGLISTPTKASSVSTVYTYAGWAATNGGAADADVLKAVKEDKTVYAAYTAATRYYTITYYDSDGTTVLKTESLAYGSTPSYTPEKDGFKFDGWTTSVEVVTGDANYTATWAEQLKLADYTWSQIDAMTLEEAQEKFAIGDAKGCYVLVAFNHDDLADGSGKAKMSFIAKDCKGSFTFPYSSTTYKGTNYTNSYQYGWPHSRTPGGYICDYDNISPYAKSVIKEYLTDRSAGSAVSASAFTFWSPSATELGYIADGTTVFDEGERYEFFTEKNLSDQMETWNGSDNQYALWRFGSLFTRSANPSGWMYLKNGILTTATANVSSAYTLWGFCI